MSVQGPLNPTAAVDNGGVSAVWANPTNALVQDGIYASPNIYLSLTPSNILRTSGYGFSLPTAAVIDGIVLEIYRYGIQAEDLAIRLFKAGVVAGSNKAFGNWQTSPSYSKYGSATDLWGTTWTAADINNSGFGGGVAVDNRAGDGGSAYVDHMRVTVYWHIADPNPAVVPKRYLYKVTTATGQPLGNLPNVISDFGYAQDINTAGSQISIEVATGIDTSYLSGDHITDEAGNRLTDEAGNQLITERQVPIIAIGSAAGSTLIKNGNKVAVWEYSYYYPNGKQMFSGQMNRWSANFGASDTIKILCYSDGQDLDNYIARGAPFAYTLALSQTSQNAGATLTKASDGSSWTYYGQTFTTAAGATNISAISLLLNVPATSTIIVSLYSDTTVTNLLATDYNYITPTGGPVEIQFPFKAPVPVASFTSYFITVEIQDGGSAAIYYSNANPYAGGQQYTASYASGSGGGNWNPQSANDLYFKTFSGTGSTTATYTNVDPSSGMLYPILLDYIARGGLIVNASIDSNVLSLTYTFNTNTILEAIKSILTISPSTYYWYVDIGTNTLYFRNLSDTADFVFTKGKHIKDLSIISTIENVKNQMYFSGGLVGATNLYKTYIDTTSTNLYGIRLERKSDNRVTVASTADAIGTSFVAGNKDEKYETTVTIMDRTMDITLLKPGKLIGFNGFGTFADNLTAQIVHIEYSPEYVTLTLGVLPKRLNPEFERVTRGLLAEQTVANPSAPS